MDIVVEDSMERFRPIEGAGKKAELKMSMAEVGEKLRNSVPGIAVIDNDFSLKTKEYELGIGGKEPGRMPEDSIKLLADLKEKGWQVLVVSNQPKEGHQVARAIRHLRGDKYPIFPDSVKEVLGEEGVDGGGKDFLWNKYKESPEAVEKTASWILGNTEKVLGQIYFVGDRESDVDFANRVSKELKMRGVNRPVNVWRVKGMELPKGLKGLEKLIP